MKFFADTADVSEIQQLAATGIIDGVTTNPSLVAKTGRDFVEIVSEICEIIDGPVSAEVSATESEQMIAEAHKLTKISDNVAIKLPLTMEGLKACRVLSGEGTQVNVTLCFSPAQAILAAKAGAAFISPFVGRLDDIGQNGMHLIEDIRTIYDNYETFSSTEILVASIRSTSHVIEAARLGADICTVPPTVIDQLVKHPLTDKGIETFLADWAKTGQSILDKE